MRNSVVNHSQNVIGFDYGTKKIGIAVGQTVTCTSRGLRQINVYNGEPNWEEIDSIIKDFNPFALVIGHPLNSDGKSQPITLAAESFAKALQTHYDLPVYCIDERLSTVEARRELFSTGGYKALSKKNIDMLSAQIILQEWLDRRRDNG